MAPKAPAGTCPGDTGGALFFALIVVTLWAVLRGSLGRAVAVAWLVLSVSHLVYHVGNLGDFGTADKLSLLGSLATIPVLAGVTLWARRSPKLLEAARNGRTLSHPSFTLRA